MSLEVEHVENLRAAHDKIDKVEDKLHDMEVVAAERHGTTISKLDQLTEMLATLAVKQEAHAQQTVDLQLDMATTKIRLSGAEDTIKTFKNRSWALVIAAIGFFGATIKALWK